MSSTQYASCPLFPVLAQCPGVLPLCCRPGQLLFRCCLRRDCTTWKNIAKQITAWYTECCQILPCRALNHQDAQQKITSLCQCLAAPEGRLLAHVQNLHPACSSCPTRLSPSCFCSPSVTPAAFSPKLSPASQTEYHVSKCVLHQARTDDCRQVVTTNDQITPPEGMDADSTLH